MNNPFKKSELKEEGTVVQIKETRGYFILCLLTIDVLNNLMSFSAKLSYLPAEGIETSGQE